MCASLRAPATSAWRQSKSDFGLSSIEVVRHSDYSPLVAEATEIGNAKGGFALKGVTTLIVGFCVRIA
jgi:hypothetical protein